MQRYILVICVLINVIRIAIMSLRRIQNAEVEGKRVLVRVDFNVELKNEDVREKYKIKAPKETIEYLLGKNAKIALISHLGRPEGKSTPEFSLTQIRDDVEEILGIKVKFVDDCIGEKVKNELEGLGDGEILLLENVRFYESEEINDPDFSKKLTENFDIFVNEAFAVCHRNQASVTGVVKNLPSFAGFWLQKEMENLEKVKNNPEHPAVAIIGGAKIETKLPLINVFEKTYDYILVGGKIANEVIDQEITFGDKVILPVDFADERLDVGMETIKKFKDVIKNAKTIVWNGPMGKFEDEKYANGTKEILEAVIGSNAYVLMGGGESVQLLEESDMLDEISFVSTGGGAMLEYLSGSAMPGIEALKE